MLYFHKENFIYINICVSDPAPALTDAATFQVPCLRLPQQIIYSHQTGLQHSATSCIILSTKESWSEAL